jgi:hypothetical protein
MGRHAATTADAMLLVTVWVPWQWELTTTFTRTVAVTFGTVKDAVVLTAFVNPSASVYHVYVRFVPVAPTLKVAG